jgi:hypothetical protein
MFIETNAIVNKYLRDTRFIKKKKSFEILENIEANGSIHVIKRHTT